MKAPPSHVKDGRDGGIEGREAASYQCCIAQHVHPGRRAESIGRALERVGGAAVTLVDPQPVGTPVTVGGGKLRQQRFDVGGTGGERVAAARQGDASPALRRLRLHQPDAVLDETLHHRLRPPVAIVLPGLGRRPGHRRAAVEQRHPGRRCACLDRVRDGDADDAGADHQHVGLVRGRRARVRPGRHAPVFRDSHCGDPSIGSRHGAGFKIVAACGCSRSTLIVMSRLFVRATQMPSPSCVMRSRPVAVILPTSIRTTAPRSATCRTPAGTRRDGSVPRCAIV